MAIIILQYKILVQMIRLSILVLLVILLSCTYSFETDSQYSYENFMVHFNRSYTGDQRAQHQAIFYKNYANLKKLRQNHDVIVNDFLDWNETQINAFFYKFSKQPNILSSSKSLSTDSLFASPLSFDWRKFDRVTEVKQQGYCGACWAFTATGQYQSLLAIATNGTKYDLSEQYVTECDSGSNGCFGGFPYSALSLINGTGIPLQSQYPYRGSSSHDNSICNQNNTRKVGYPAENVMHIQDATTEDIQQYLVNYGPLSVGINGNYDSFLYAGRSALISCPSTNYLNHAVLLVGYNSTHWFVKNSWGTTWGDNGFGYIDKVNDCGLRYWVDVMQITFPWKVTPDPVLNKITLTIEMTDSYGDGWNNNIFGLKQNGVIVATFGKEFTSGKTYGPVNVAIVGQLQTQIVMVQYSSYTQEIGFTIKSANGNVIFKRNNGVQLDKRAILYHFCPQKGCDNNMLVSYYLTLSDSRGDGWNGNVLLFRQNKTFKKFSLQNNYTSGPHQFIFVKGINVDVVVAKLGSSTAQIGFILRTYSGAVVASHTPGIPFTSDQKLLSFCPGCSNFDYVQTIPDTSGRSSIQSNQLRSYKIATFVLAGLLLLAIILGAVAVIKSKKVTQVYSQPPESSKNVNSQDMRPQDDIVVIDDAQSVKNVQASGQ